VPSGPKHGEVGHKLKVGADAWVEVTDSGSLWFHRGKKSRKRGGEDTYEQEDSASVETVPSAKSPAWVQSYWGEVYLVGDYNGGEASLKKLNVYENILNAMVGNAIEFGEEPSAQPDDLHPRIAEFWRECALGIRDEIEGKLGEGEQTPARRAGAAYARERELRGVIQWNEAEQRFVFASEASAS
jgi:hypothetical protein